MDRNSPINFEDAPIVVVGAVLMVGECRCGKSGQGILFFLALFWSESNTIQELKFFILVTTFQKSAGEENKQEETGQEKL